MPYDLLGQTDSTKKDQGGLIMPTLRKLYALSDIKMLIAKQCGVDACDVEVFEINTLMLDSGVDRFPVDDDTYIFQVDLPEVDS